MYNSYPEDTLLLSAGLWQTVVCRKLHRLLRSHQVSLPPHASHLQLRHGRARSHRLVGLAHVHRQPEHV